MKYYTRTTHNFNNKTREWEYRSELDKSNYFKERSILGIHALDCGRWHSLQEIIDRNKSYYEQWINDPYSGVRIEATYEDVILHDLEQLEKCGLIKSKE